MSSITTYPERIPYATFLERLRAQARGAAENHVYAELEELGRPWPVIRLTTPGSRRLTITAGFHGEEPAGPLTLMNHFRELAAYAQARDVALTVYPCINPSGFEGGHRYNASGEQPNNDFLRYVLPDGRLKGELDPGEAIDRWYLFGGGPKETRAVRADIDAHPAPHAALDLHQDAWVRRPCHYAYVFGDKAPYRALVRQTAPLAKASIHMLVHEHKVTDDCGLIVDHDGSVTDYFHRRGTRWTVALETSTRTPLEQAMRVNLLWLRAFVDFAAGEPEATPLPLEPLRGAP